MKIIKNVHWNILLSVFIFVTNKSSVGDSTNKRRNVVFYSFPLFIRVECEVLKGRNLDVQ